jgi:hypothetical protein
MSGSLIPNAKQQFLDGNGNPLAGGFVYFYIPSTTTFKNTYQNAALTILNTNPIILDSAGEAIIYGNGSYRQIVTDVNGNLIWDQPTVTCATTDYVDSAISGLATITYVDTSIAAATSNGNFVTLTVGGTQLGAGNSSLLKNRIINGAMVIDQRNVGAIATATDLQYSLDRWQTLSTQTSKFSVQQGSSNPTIGFTNYLTAVSLSAYSVLASDTFDVQQSIEGYNIADLGWGTANAKTVTLSFKAISSLTGTFGGAITNSATNRSYPFSYSIPTANTWTTINVTIPGDTSGTWLTNNGIGMIVRFGLGSGSIYTRTAGSWQAGNFVQPDSTVSVVGTNNANWAATAVQLEVGIKATGFEYRQYGQELLLCQRYFQKSYEDGTALGAVTTNGIVGGYIAEANGRATSITFQVPLRTTPTINYWDGVGNATKYSSLTNGTWVNNQSAGFALNSTSSKGVILSATSGSAGSTGFIQYAVSAEL